MRKLEVFLPTFCEQCGKDRIVALVAMYNGLAWMCFPCQIRYMVRTFGRRHPIAENLKRAKDADSHAS